MKVTLLGPQRRTTATRNAVAELIPTGAVATINAGWREREAADGELGEVLGDRMINLRLFQRWQQVTAADPEFAAAERGLHELLDEQQAVYAQRLFHAVASLDEVNRRDKMSTVRAAAVADGIRALRALDTWHLGEVAASRQRFYETTSIGERDSILAHRRELAEIVGGSGGLVITGGHVGVLLQLLHVFGLVAMIKTPAMSTTPVITWSAGAMALSDRVVLVGAHRPAGRRLPEVWAEGLGVFSGALPFPHPRHRLPMHDPYQLALLARRFKGWTCLLFDDGVRVDLSGSWPPPVGARWITREGAIWTRTADDVIEERAGVPFDETGQPARRPADADVVTARTA